MVDDIITSNGCRPVHDDKNHHDPPSELYGARFADICPDKNPQDPISRSVTFYSKSLTAALSSFSSFSVTSIRCLPNSLISSP